MGSSGTVDKFPWLDRRWYRGPVSQEEAEAFCRSLASRHYENFSVLSPLLPAPFRQHFANVYAFCRISDDLADELRNANESVMRLDEWQEHLEECYAGKAAHPVFIALQDTIRRFDIPKKPFLDLLAAFRQDQIKSRYQAWPELLEYCAKSANPVGRLVLYIAGYRDERRQELSDCTCTALQLANFWQDVSRDYERGRVYIPSDILHEFGYSEDMLRLRTLNDSWQNVMKDLIGRTRKLFMNGLELTGLIQGRMRVVILLFSQGGLAVLRKIEKAGYSTLVSRPYLTRWDKGRLIINGLLRIAPLRERKAGV
jgi:squalene synthase HpnC